ncbi:MAG TPA: glycerophosphodiester phosphodiesterase family protein, partial [Cellvibrionaceae bacterium]|nr:glycerophosphodiester phosphodiesterase family protein [Cellvibrionaceae bacterium]
DHAWSREGGYPSLSVQLGPRPFYLVEDMDASPLKRKLQACALGKAIYKPTQFSIGHRGAALQFPEHTQQSYEAAAKMGAGIIECDVTFTKDKQLVCRHSQCDLHTTTNILAVPELAAKCRQPFVPADELTGKPASAECCTTDITLAEFKSLSGKMDGFNPKAKTPAEYLQGTPAWRTDLYASQGTLMTHAESIQLIKKLGAKFTPELKSASVAMPYEGTYSQAMYAQQMIDEYKAAGINPRDVFAQSFDGADIRFWIKNEPKFGRQAVYLDDANTPAELPSAADLKALKAEGVKIVAPPLWALVKLDNKNKIVPSDYALNAKAAGLEIITWSFERAGPLKNGGGWYYQTVNSALNNDGDMMEVLDVIARQVGVIGVFSDWPASVSFYANCMGLE